jgi:prepilin-type N-terminal cleavage/methylation domain-containing protein
MEQVENIKYEAERKCKSPRLSDFHLSLSAPSRSSGFTLVEMLVSIAIFMIVAVIAVAALLKIVDASKKSQTLQDTVNNINYAMDSITREIRLGSAYTCYPSGMYTGPILQTSQGAQCSPLIISGNSNSNSGTSIAFLSSNTAMDQTNGQSCNLTYAYYFEPVQVPGSNPAVYTWTIEKAQQESNDPSYPSDPCADPLGNTYTQYVPIIDPSIIITAYSLKVNTAVANTQPSVFLYISGYTGSASSTQTYFNLQTTISERT